MNHPVALLAATLGIGLSLAPRSSRAGIDLFLMQPESAGCGQVSINGAVFANPGVIERMVWDWDDGAQGESWFPATHAYRANGTYMVRVVAYASTGETRTVPVAVTVADLVPACDNTLRVYPPVLLLKAGRTSARLQIDLRDPDGRPLPCPLSDATFSSSAPDLVQVDANGVARGTGFGRARIDVQLAGQPRRATVQVVAGDVWLEPPILLLAVEEESAGQAALFAARADGAPLDLAEHAVAYQGGNDVAAVDASGNVTALRPPLHFWDSPYITASVDGIPARNATFVRVTQSPLGLNMQGYQGELVSLRIAEAVQSHPYGALMEQLEVVQVMDAVYRIERRLCGSMPHEGGRQFFVLDPGLDEDGTVPCGLSGNPIRLGVGVDNLRSCFGGVDWIQWGVMSHELAHNFLLHASFQDFLSGLPSAFAYSEGMATVLGAYSLDEILRDPGRHGIDPATVASFTDPYLPLGPENIRHVHYVALADYERAPDYATALTPDVMDAIIFTLIEEFGSGFLFRLMSVFYPPEEIFLSYRSEIERLTFWVAACSAAAGSDLRARFRDRWGYAIDDAHVDGILPLLRKRAGQRDPLIRDAWPGPGGFHFEFQTIPDAAYAVAISPDMKQWTDLFELTASDYLTSVSDPVPAGSKAGYYRIRMW